MDRRVAYVLAIIACLMTRGSARDCLECWSEVCEVGDVQTDNNFLSDCCNCVMGNDCLESVISADRSQQCCSMANENIASLFPQAGQSSVDCNGSYPYPFIQPDDIIPVSPPDILLPAAYLVPRFHFQCSGCVDQVQVLATVDDYNIQDPINRTMSFTTWRHYIENGTVDDDSLYIARNNISQTVNETNIEVFDSSRNDQFLITFAIANDLCFESNDVFGFSYGPSSRFNVILTNDNLYKDENILQLLPHSGEVCSELSDFHTTVLNQTDRVPQLVIRTRTPQQSSSSVTQPPTSASVVVTQSSTTIQEPGSISSTTSPRVPAPSSTTTSLSISSRLPDIDIASNSQELASQEIIIGIVGGLVVVLAVIIICSIVLLLIISHRKKKSTDKVDGRAQGLTRLRSVRMEERLQHNSQIQHLPVGPDGRVFYDYPTTQVHPYHELEPPSSLDPQHHTLLSSTYQAMQPAGSIREGAITPMGFYRTDAMGSIYDEELLRSQPPASPDTPEPPPRPVHDTPFYHILEDPTGHLNGQAVAQVGYDDPVELIKKKDSQEEIVNPIYNEISPKPQGNPQNDDPSLFHPYHVLENPAEGRRGKGAEGETVEEHGLYVPTAEERRRILGNPSKTEIDLQNWIRKNRAESTKKRKFFESTSTYWKPPSDADSLYNTLARRKYREILSDQIQIVKYMGSGQFGTVNLAVWKQPHLEPMEVAVKVCRAGKNEAIKTKFLKEAAIMGQFRHPNVVKLYGVVTMSELPMIVLELMKNGDLLEYMKKNFEPGRLPPPSSTRLHSFSMQVARGMEYLSSKAFVHRDLAARNILLNELHQCKIGDFGMARDLEESEYYIMSKKGPLPLKWTAPEALNFRKYSTFSDCYSYGMVLYEIWSVGREPLPGVTLKEVPDIISKGFCQAPPPGCPRAIYELMVKLWNPNKRHRPTFPDIVKYLNGQEEQLLGWSEEDRAVSAQASVLGAPLEEGKNLYPTLQNAYQSSWC